MSRNIFLRCHHIHFRLCGDGGLFAVQLVWLAHFARRFFGVLDGRFEFDGERLLTLIVHLHCVGREKLLGSLVVQVDVLQPLWLAIRFWIAGCRRRSVFCDLRFELGNSLVASGVVVWIGLFAILEYNCKLSLTTVVADFTGPSLRFKMYASFSASVKWPYFFVRPGNIRLSIGVSARFFFCFSRRFLSAAFFFLAFLSRRLDEALREVANPEVEVAMAFGRAAARLSFLVLTCRRRTRTKQIEATIAMIKTLKPTTNCEPLCLAFSHSHYASNNRIQAPAKTTFRHFIWREFGVFL